MSYTTLYRQQDDPAFTARVTACAVGEAFLNPDLSNTAYAAALRASSSNADQIVWPVSVATQVAYAYAIDMGNPNPGGDESVITDADVLAAVQAHWPPDPT